MEGITSLFMNSFLNPYKVFLMIHAYLMKLVLLKVPKEAVKEDQLNSNAPEPILVEHVLLFLQMEDSVPKSILILMLLLLNTDL